MHNNRKNIGVIEDEMTKTTLLIKGFDIDTEEGLSKAAEFLKNATWEDAFVFDAPLDYYKNADPAETEIDKFIGTLRLGILQANVRHRLARNKRSAN